MLLAGIFCFAMPYVRACLDDFSLYTAVMRGGGSFIATTVHSLEKVVLSMYVYVQRFSRITTKADAVGCTVLSVLV